MAARYVRIGQYPDYRDEVRGTLAEILASTANPGTYAAPEDVAGCTLEMGVDGLWTGASVGTLTQVQADALVASGVLASVKTGTILTIGENGALWNGASVASSGNLAFTNSTAANAWASANPSLVYDGLMATIGGVPYSWSGSAWEAVGGSTPRSVEGPVGIATFGDSTATMRGNTTPYLWPQESAATIPSNISPSATFMIGSNSRGYCRYVGDCGIGGTTTASMLQRGAAAASNIRKAIADLSKIPNLHVVIVRGGSINDCTSFTTATSDATINAAADRNIRIVKKILAMGYSVVDVGIYGYDGDGYGGGPSAPNLAAIRRAIVMINSRIKSTLDGYSSRCTFVDTDGITHAGGAFLAGSSDDGVHLTILGASRLEVVESSAIRSLVVGVPNKTCLSDYDELWLNPSSGLPSTITSLLYGGGPGASVVSEATSEGLLTATVFVTNTPVSEYRVYIPIVPQISGMVSGDRFSWYYRAEVTDSNGNAVNAAITMNILLFDSANSGYFVYEVIGANVQSGIAESLSIPLALDRDASNLGSSSRLQFIVNNLPSNGTYIIKLYPPCIYVE